MLAFEPVLYNQMVAHAVLRRYSNVRLLPFGLSDTEIETEILMATRSSGAWVHGGASVAMHRRDDPRNSPEVFVSNLAKLRPMDDVFEEAGVDRLGFMKIEGLSHYWGLIWVSLEDKQLEHATLDEHVSIRQLLDGGEVRRSSVLRRGTLTKALPR